MKISKHAYVTFWDVHAWGGVVCAWLLHLMFFFGALTLFQGEIRSWEDPLEQTAPVVHRARDVPALLERYAPPLHKLAEASVYLEHPFAISFQRSGASDYEYYQLNRETDALVLRRASVAKWFDDLHSLSIDQALWLERVAGFVCVLLGLSLVIGVLFHLKDLARQLVQLRRTKGIQVFWSDLHKVLGVWGFPFFLLFAWSGALLMLDDWAAGAVAQTMFHKDEPSAQRALSSHASPPEPGAGNASILPLSQLIERAQRELPGCDLTFFRFHSPGRAEGVLKRAVTKRASSKDTVASSCVLRMDHSSKGARPALTRPPGNSGDAGSTNSTTLNTAAPGYSEYLCAPSMPLARLLAASSFSQATGFGSRSAIARGGTPEIESLPASQSVLARDSASLLRRSSSAVAFSL